MRDDSWREDAACRGLDTDMFFPGPGQLDQINTAYRICSRCPVKAECREEAERFDARHGIWGGQSSYARTRVDPPKQPDIRKCRPPLTTAEQERILELSALGWTPNEIARDVGVSSRSVGRVLARHKQESGAAA